MIDEEIPVERTMTVLQTTGTDALASMSDEAFDRQLAAIRSGQVRIARMQKELLIAGTDYGNIPGVDKPSLGKPGAEKICLAYRFAARVEQRLTIGDGITEPTLRYDADCHLHLGSFDGPEVGVGHGSCNSWETKYRWRNAERACPNCGKPVRHSKPPRAGWYCWTKTGGCGAEFAENAKEIKDQVVGREENPEPWDLANTIMKMAEKRAHVDATLRTTAASGIFTQDLEDNVPAIEGEYTEVKEQRPAPAVSRPPRAIEPPVVTDEDLSGLNDPALWNEPELVPAYPSETAEGLTSAEFKAFLAAEGFTTGDAMNAAYRIFPSWNGKRDLTNAERQSVRRALVTP